MQGLRSPEMRSLLVVNEQFSGKRNAAGGHYGQTLVLARASLSLNACFLNHLT